MRPGESLRFLRGETGVQLMSELAVPFVRLWWGEGDVLECDWGRIDNTEGDPVLGFRPLVVVSCDWLERLVGGPAEDRFGTVCSLGDFGVGGLFFYARRGERRWAWQLSPARWRDEWVGPAVMVGRWRD